MSRVQRRKFLTAAGVLLVLPLASLAQQQGKVRRIGFLAARSRSTPTNPDAYYDAFTQGMRELGYVEGKNLLIEWRFAEQKFDRLPSLAAELVRLNTEVIVTHSTAATKALQRATNTLPIVSANMGDPVGSGFVTSLSRPGGNITGLSGIPADVAPKQIELLRLMVPALSRAAVLLNPGTGTHPFILKSIQAAAQRLGVKILPINASTPEEIERGFVAIKREHANAIIILGDSFFIGQRRQITELAAHNRIPSLFEWREDVEAGGLMSYGQNAADSYRRAANYVDKILKGARPADLPVEQPTKFEFVVNAKAAKGLGLAIPQSVLVRADDVIR